ncbi:MAG: hypothetical protein GXN91_00700 [Epsilonproteobacteria bacterium]|nr:hypothetical protein [Campylobacterota bacterium]
MSEGKKELSSEMHSLFIETIPEKKILVDKERNLYEIIPKHRLFTVYIGKFFEQKRGLHNVFQQLREAKEEDYLVLRINSGGGLILEGQQFYNVIQEKFYNRVIAYLDNYGYSMGALLFCMANKRVAYKYSDFMFHNYSSGIVGKGGEIKDRFKHTNKKLKQFFKEIIVKNGFLTKKEFKQLLLGKDFWMDTKELCKRGIATHVIIEGKEITAKEYLEKYS